MVASLRCPLQLNSAVHCAASHIVAFQILEARRPEFLTHEDSILERALLLSWPYFPAWFCEFGTLISPFFFKLKQLSNRTARYRLHISESAYATPAMIHTSAFSAKIPSSPASILLRPKPMGPRAVRRDSVVCISGPTDSSYSTWLTKSPSLHSRGFIGY